MVFLQVAQELRGEAPIVVDAIEKRRVLVGYFAGIQEHFRTDRGTLGRMKKIANYFTHGLPYGSELRTAFLHSRTIDEALEHTETYFERLADFERGEPWAGRGGGDEPDDALPEVPEGGDSCAV